MLRGCVLLAGLSGPKISTYRRDKGTCSHGDRDSAVQDMLETLCGAAVKGVRIVGVLRDHRSVQVNSANRPFDLEYVKSSAFSFRSVPAAAFRPTGPAAAAASAPILNFDLSRS